MGTARWAVPVFFSRPENKFGDPSGSPDSSFPLRRSEDRSSFCESVTGNSDASHGVGCSPEYYERRSIRRIGLPDPTSSPCFQRLGGFSSAPSPVPLRVRVHPLMSLASSTEYVAACHLLDTRAERLPWGPSSHSRHKRTESTKHRGSHPRLRSAHSVSRALDGFLLHTPCGLVSSHCHVRDSHLREFPRCQAGSPHRRVVPSCRCRDSPHGELPRRCQIHSIRLQGLAPSSGPLRKTGGLDLPSTRFPLVFSAPAGFTPAALVTPSRPLRS